jgi:hypothetical protein
MPIVYSHPTSDREIFESQMKTTRAQLAKINRELNALQAQQERDPYGWEWKQKLPPLTQLKHRLEAQLRGQEAGFRAAGGSPDGPRALTGGSYWLPPDS